MPRRVKIALLAANILESLHVEEHVIACKGNCSQVGRSEAGAHNGVSWPGTAGASRNTSGQQEIP